MEKQIILSKKTSIEIQLVPAFGFMVGYQKHKRSMNYVILLPGIMIEIERKRKQKEISGVTVIN